MNETYNLVFKFGELGMYGLIPGIKEAMQHELMRVYNIYADKCNSGITEKLNAEFHHLYPNYFEDNKGKDWWDLVDYNQFIADGYKSSTVAASCICVAIKRSGYPIKSFKRGEFVYLSKVS